MQTIRLRLLGLMILASVVGPKSPSLAEIIFSESFETGFPGTLWDVRGSPSWDDTSDSYRRGSWSGWCAASTLPSSDGYVDNMNSWMVYGPFSLSDATNAIVRFWFKNYSESGLDYFKWYASTNGVKFSGWQISGDENTWRNLRFDLATVPTYGNLCGKSQVWIAFVFTSNGSVSGPTYTGAFVDDVTIEKNITTAADLTPYKPAAWNDKIPIGTSRLYFTNTHDHSISGPFNDTQTLYFNWASSNQGSDTAFNYTVHCEVTGAGGTNWDWLVDSTAVGSHTSLTSDQPVGPLAAGSHTFKLWVDYDATVGETNEFNNHYERTITITVIDSEPPTITCPADITTTNDVGQSNAVVNLGVPAATNDNCGILTVTNDAPASLPVGTNLVTWTAVDTSGNLATCVQTVTVAASSQSNLAISYNGGMVFISWGAGALQRADNVSGNYMDVTNAASPYRIAASALQEFYRLRYSAP